MRRKLFTLAASVSLVLCGWVALMQIGNYGIRDGFGDGYGTNPLFHRGYYSFRLLDFEINYWLAVLVTAVLPLWWVIARVARVVESQRKRHRQVAGLCPSCGYDLRATPGRCPECGTPVSDKAAQD